MQSKLFTQVFADEMQAIATNKSGREVALNQIVAKLY